MKKALYLEGRRPIRVLRDGPALRVRRAGEADRLFPLGRLSRVVVLGAVDWNTDALLACAEAGVTVEFLGHDGERRASLSGPPVAGGVLVNIGSLLASLLEEPEGPAHYRRWLAGEDNRARLALRARCRWTVCPVSRHGLARVLRQRARHDVRSADLDFFDSRLRGLMEAQVDGLLRHYGMEPDMPALSVAGVNPASDLVSVIWWGLQLDKLTFIRRLGHSARRRNRGKAALHFQAAVGFFESHAERVNEEAQRLLVRLHRFLLEETRRHAAS